MRDRNSLPLLLQTGEETETVMGSFLLCGEGQLHDLHSKLVLQHPRGTANQLHKCARTAHALFPRAVMHTLQHLQA